MRMRLCWRGSGTEQRELAIASEGCELDEPLRHGSGFVRRSLARIWRSAPAKVDDPRQQSESDPRQQSESDPRQQSESDPRQQGEGDPRQRASGQAVNKYHFIKSINNIILKEMTL